ncbi:MAG: Lrp/AsnC family transcriptional regulator [Gammaproteobacteria bacterium]|nr:Lrp/AsnC family transcriptional regulator [Gammaproteobacteria bacterium]
MANEKLQLDRTDKRILEHLQRNARASNLELAEAVGLSATPCARRVKRLEDSGIIRAYVALLDAQQLGLSLTAMISISMDRHTPERFAGFEAAVATMPEVVECSIVTGQSADYLLKAVVPDMGHYEAFLLGKLTKIDGVTGVHSSFVLRKIVASTALPLDHLR